MELIESVEEGKRLFKKQKVFVTRKSGFFGQTMPTSGKFRGPLIGTIGLVIHSLGHTDGQSEISPKQVPSKYFQRALKS